MEFWEKRVFDHLEVIKKVAGDAALLGVVNRVSNLIVKAFRSGGKLLLCGNGGSAADAQHFAAELVCRFLLDRKPLNAEALSVNSSSLTAIGNDYSYDAVFERQVEAKGQKGDVLIGISTSGNSRNVVKALEKGKEIGMITVALTGANRESAVCKAADYSIAVPSKSTPRIQEAHSLIEHMICEYIEKELFG